MKRFYFLSVWIGWMVSCLIWPEISRAQNRICDGSIGAVTVGSISIPDGASCVLRGIRVRGNLWVGVNATLVASEVRIAGNVEATGATQVRITFFSVVGGNIQVQRSRNVLVSATRVNGNVVLAGNRGNVSVRGSEIVGNLEILRNTGKILIRNNRLGGSLICRQNQQYSCLE
jgi:hypothetical protein